MSSFASRLRHRAQFSTSRESSARSPSLIIIDLRHRNSRYLRPMEVRGVRSRSFISPRVVSRIFFSTRPVARQEETRDNETTRPGLMFHRRISSSSAARNEIGSNAHLLFFTIARVRRIIYNFVSSADQPIATFNECFKSFPYWHSDGARSTAHCSRIRCVAHVTLVAAHTRTYTSSIRDASYLVTLVRIDKTMVLVGANARRRTPPPRLCTALSRLIKERNCQPFSAVGVYISQHSSRRRISLAREKFDTNQAAAVRDKYI